MNIRFQAAVFFLIASSALAALSAKLSRRFAAGSVFFFAGYASHNLAHRRTSLTCAAASLHCMRATAVSNLHCVRPESAAYFGQALQEGKSWPRARN